MGALLLLGTLVVCFLLGSIPWGLIISRLFFRTDIRAQGSGNIGTTNALRTLGKRGGAAVFVLDFGKGLLAGFIGWLIAAHLAVRVGVVYGGLLQPEGFVTCALAGCVLGHIYSPWLGFKGGKGIAVAIGCLFVSYGWIAAVAELGIFIVVVALTRYVSAGSLAAAVACPLIALYLFWGDWLSVFFGVLVGITIIWAHRGNIRRLREGNENRLGKR
jgi:glycerol-3-phosphate acyltransferase PlsY